MIPDVRGKFGVTWFWRTWTLGFQFGPEVWKIHVGPLTVWFDPEGLHDPKYEKGSE